LSKDFNIKREGTTMNISESKHYIIFLNFECFYAMPYMAPEKCKRYRFF